MDNQTTNDKGDIRQSEPFDYDGVSAALNEDIDLESELAHLTAEDYEKAFKVIRGLMLWINQNGSRNMDGIAIRAIILSWIVLPHLQPLTLTELAADYGKHKQSFGRGADSFKSAFPTVKTAHMKFD